MSKGRKPSPAQAGEQFGRITLVADSYLKPSPRRCERPGRKSGNESYALGQCECGTVKEYRLYSLRGGNTKSCGCYAREVMRTSRLGPAHPMWKGGRHHDGGGYVRVLVPGHPDAAQDGYIREHRLVMEKKLGRRLLPSETVHHVNGVVDDNCPENLQLRIGKHGSGVAYACSDCGSQRIHPIPLAEADDRNVTTYQEV